MTRTPFARLAGASILVALSLLLAGAAAAQPPAEPSTAAEAPAAAEPSTPAAAEPSTAAAAEPATPAPAQADGPRFDPVAATEAYLATVPADKRASSDAYFEGGYWLKLWSFLWSAAVAAFLLWGRISARMRDLARRLTRFRPLQTALYWVQYLLLTTLFDLPLLAYSGYFRERAYGLATQTFGGWLGDQAKGLGVGLVLGTIFVVILYGVLRRAPRTWWLWGAAVTVAFLAFVAVITPVYINPIFNQYVPLRDEPVRGRILSLARANGIPADEVWEMDASRQTTRISANVSGFLGTERVTLNDNLLKRCTLPEIEAVMGHEMGHYVLNHVYELIVELGLVIVVGFAFLRWATGRALRRYGERWGVAAVDDPAGLPLLVVLLAAFFLVMSPVVNTIIRANEAEADIFGLNASRQPDGFATVALKLGEYRKLAPGPLEEWIFFDHPSGRSRILMAMRWKAEQAGATAAAAGP
jgi:Zn-dependent protease with chaperone function